MTRCKNIYIINTYIYIIICPWTIFLNIIYKYYLYETDNSSIDWETPNQTQSILSKYKNILQNIQSNVINNKL